MQKTKTLIVLFLAILIAPAVLQAASTAVAETAATDIPVYLKVYAEPNPVGVSQTVYLSLFFTKPIPIVGSSGGGSLYTGLTLNIVEPDGTNTTQGPITADPISSGYITFTPTAIGNYKFQFSFPG